MVAWYLVGGNYLGTGGGSTDLEFGSEANTEFFHVLNQGVKRRLPPFLGVLTPQWGGAYLGDWWGSQISSSDSRLIRAF
jgi:hypothetical protein